jgi:sulfatase-like protein
MKRSLIVHPFLFAVYAILAVYANNSGDIPIQWVFRPLIVLLVCITILFLFLRWKLADSQRAAFITTLVLFWLFFGHIHRYLSEKSAFWSTPTGTWIAFFLWTAPLIFFASSWTWNRITNRRFITLFLNTTSIIVVLLPAFITARSSIETLWYSSLFKRQRMAARQITLPSQTAKPDVYLLILDAYGREDVLKELYGFDNQEFIGYLRKKGFYIAEQSTPNYPTTWFSLSSLLNMQYLDDYISVLKNTQAHGPIYDLLQHSEMRLLLQSAGYRFVALPSATFFTRMLDADVYFKMNESSLNEFEGLLLSSTIANIGIEAWNLDIPVPSYSLHRRYISYSLETLKSVPKMDGPKFVFAHFMAPHPPFVLDANGNALEPDRPYTIDDASTYTGTSEEYAAGYIGEVRFLDRQLMDVIDTILAQSEQPPIIIIQGDHGPGNHINLLESKNDCLKERYSILNAYYFPDGNYSSLYPSITPVNSFRVVLNQYFGSHLDLLEDRNYYSTWVHPYQLTDVTDQAQSCELLPKE